MHVGIHTFRILGESLEVIQHRFLEIHFFHLIISSVRPSGSGGGLLPKLFTQWRLQIPNNQEQYFSTKSYHCPPPPPPRVKNSFTQMTYASFQTFYASRTLLDPQVDGSLSEADSIFYSIFRSAPLNLFGSVIIFCHYFVKLSSESFWSIFWLWPHFVF